MRLAFIDTETTGLNELYDVPWEIAAIIHDTETASRVAHLWHPKLPLGMRERIFHSGAAEVNHFFDREPDIDWQQRDWVADKVREALKGAHPVGNNIKFDISMLRSLYRSDWKIGIKDYKDAWNYQSIELTSMAVLAAAWSRVERDIRNTVPWKTEDLFRSLGVEPLQGEQRHIAMSDALWCERVFEALFGPITNLYS